MEIRDLENLVLSVSSQIDDTKCIEAILNRDNFILPFYKWRCNALVERHKNGEKDIGVLKDLLNYIILHDSICSSSNLVYLQDCTEIISYNYLTKSRSELVTDVAASSAMLQVLQTTILRENRDYMLRSHIISNIGVIQNEFLEYFRKNSAHAFQFDGTFEAFVANSFLKYFWAPYKKDLWKKIKAKDSLALEVEKNIVNISEIEEVVNDDLRAGPLIKNIYTMSEKLFNHSGHSSNAKGILYDAYYLILTILCNDKIEIINKELKNAGSKIKLNFIDVYSYKFDTDLARLGITPKIEDKKGMASKIVNAREITSTILQKVREHNITPENLYSLSLQCFEQGKTAVEGKNSPWRVSSAKTTIKDLSDTVAIANYNTFDILVKGIISTYTLMYKLQERGKSIVDEYNAPLFRNHNIVRNVNYYSDIKVIPEILAIQEEQSKNCLNVGEAGLMDFDSLVTHIVGSENNGDPRIREGRAKAYQQGLLTEHYKKKSSSLSTEYEKLATLAGVFTSLPREFGEEYGVRHIRGLIDNQGRKEHTYSNITTDKVVNNYYADIKRNLYLILAPNVTDNLMGNSKYELLEEHCDLSTLGFNGIVLTNNYNVCINAIENPLTGNYIFAQYNSNTLSYDIVTSSAADIVSVLKDWRAKGYSNSFIAYKKQTLSDINISNIYNDKLSQSLGFKADYEFFINDVSLDLLIKNCNVFHKYRVVALKYLQGMSELIRLQKSYLDLCRIIIISAFEKFGIEDKKIAAENIINSFLKQSFNQNTLTDALDEVYSYYQEKGKIAGTIQGSRIGEIFDNEDFDMIALNLIYGDEINADKSQSYKVKSSTVTIKTKYAEVQQILDNDAYTIADKFILLHAYISNKLDFSRYLRDAYELLFTLSSKSIDTLSSELDFIFDIKGKLYDFIRGKNMTYIAGGSISEEQIEQFIIAVRNSSYTDYKSAIEGLDNYIEQCNSDISALAEYDINTGIGISEELYNWGIGFSLKPELEGARDLMPKVPVLADKTGFYRNNGTYVNAEISGHRYYIHSSGRLLEEHNGVYKPFNLNLSSESDISRYRYIVEKAMSF